MWDKVRNFALRSLPYLVSIAGGVILFSISLDNVKDPAVEALISNISASLLAIPLVFLLYDYTTTKVSRQLQKTLRSGVNDKINTVILHVLLVLRKMMGMRGRVTRANIAAIRKISESHMTQKIYVRAVYADMLHGYYGELENIILGYGKENVLGPEQLRLLNAMARDIARTVSACRIGGHRRAITEFIRNIAMEITDWIDTNPDVAQSFNQLLNTDNQNSK